ncbi:hypothetical protein [Coralloluteibacterium stylophorae]|uniref:Uncharacterized protein n=1 Tax=Coralloluteibacterium stylophorae TaxID=1776034 RepID=A0A8J7VSJ7_9GAMM|nr:hypothetical protein [Coralloluteibacterium stylophorae]MBS7456764.1 hypothetical protein [Coralloluteibacterium stylophorae]
MHPSPIPYDSESHDGYTIEVLAEPASNAPSAWRVTAQVDFADTGARLTHTEPDVPVESEGLAIAYGMGVGRRMARGLV